MPFILKWKSLITGYTGQGSHAFPDYNSIIYYIDSIKDKDRYIIYEAVKASNRTPLLDIKF